MNATARATIIALGSATDSGSRGIKSGETLKKPASFSESARSQDSTSLTAIRKHILGATVSRRSRTQAGSANGVLIKVNQYEPVVVLGRLIVAGEAPAEVGLSFLPVNGFWVCSDLSHDAPRDGFINDTLHRTQDHGIVWILHLLFPKQHQLSGLLWLRFR